MEKVLPQFELLLSESEGDIMLDDINITDVLNDIGNETDVSKNDVRECWKNFIKDKEIWATIREYPNYKVSNKGRVKNFKTGNFISQKVEGQYYRVSVRSNNKQYHYQVHILVATYFCPNSHPLRYLVVDHINFEKLDNDATNLRWVTYSKNRQNRKTKPKKLEQYDLNGKLIKIWESVKEAVESLGLIDSCIRRCCNGGGKSYHGFKWKYHNVEIRPERERVDEKERKENYVPIGILKVTNKKTHEIYHWDFSKYSIKKDGSKIINGYGLVLTFTQIGGYKMVKLNEPNGDYHGMRVHKIISAILRKKDYGYKDHESVVDHKDGKKDNNDLENLEEVTTRENAIRAIGKSVKQIDIITGKVIKIFDCVADASREFKNNDRCSIRKVCNGKRMTAYGYKWEWNI